VLIVELYHYLYDSYSLVLIVICYQEITTEVRNSIVGEESTVIDDTENNSPVTQPVIILSLSFCKINIIEYIFELDIGCKQYSNNSIIL